MARRPDPDNILITGASSGLGAALAKAYARPGARLALQGRCRDRLDAVAEGCRARGAEVTAACLDVTDRAAAESWVRETNARHALDLVIANAGVSGGTAQGLEGPEQVRHLFAVNVDGVVNTVLPAIDGMIDRKRGQIALMSSLAGYRGFPGAPAYSASKAAVKGWGEALRPGLRREGVGVSVICPGFVRTPMTAVNDFPMPFLMDVERAAALIVRRLRKNPARIAFPWPTATAAWLIGSLPAHAADLLLSRLPAKG